MIFDKRTVEVVKFFNIKAVVAIDKLSDFGWL